MVRGVAGKDRGVVHVLRVTVAGFATALLARFLLSGDLNGTWLATVTVLAFGCGAAAGSWWALATTPMALWFGLALRPDPCPGCESSEPFPAGAVFAIVAVGIILLALPVGGGVMASRLAGRLVHARPAGRAVPTVLGLGRPTP